MGRSDRFTKYLDQMAVLRRVRDHLLVGVTIGLVLLALRVVLCLLAERAG